MVKSMIALLFLLSLALQGEEYFLDLRKVANMDYRDDVTGDGKGGWSDQGAENDFRTLDFRRRDFGGMEFRLINPAENGNRAVMTFDSPHASTGLKEASIVPASMGKYSYLYLLHTSCWNQLPPGTVVGTVEVVFDDNSTQTIDIRAGKDIADWWNPGGLSNGQVVVRRENGQASVGIYLSKFKLAKTPGIVKRLTFRTSRKAVWLVIAATLSPRDLPLTGRKNIYRETKEWKAVDTADVLIQKGTALDVSDRLGQTVAGERGRLIVNAAGKLAFEREATVPVRLNGFTYFGMRRLGGTSRAETQRNIEAFAEQTKRQGYNLVRPLCLDMVLMDGAKEDCAYNPEMLDRFDYLLAELKKRGIYLYLTIGAYRLGFCSFSFADNMDFKMRMYLGDREIRNRWKYAAETLLNHRNPYTGIALRDEPAVACIEFFNEIELGQRLGRLSRPVRDQLRERYREWQLKHASAELPLPEEMPVDAADEGANRFGLFLLDLSRETVAWCEDILRGNGYGGLVSQFNCSPRLLDSVARWELSPVTSYNSYFSHPSGRTAGGRCSQASSIGSQAGYLRNFNSVRLSGRPFFVTEHNHAFWNRYQHEDGLLFGAYAALQGFDAVMVHSDPVELEIRDGNNDFSVARNPVGRAGEFLAGCLFHRGDVMTAPHRVELQVPADYWSSKGNGNRGLSMEQCKIGLLTGFSIAFPGVTLPAELKQVQYPVPDLRLSPVGGVAIRGGDWFTSLKESSVSSIQPTVLLLRRQRVLSPENLTDPAAGIFQSETGEITLRARENLMKVVTRRSEAVSLEAGKREPVGRLTVMNSTVPALTGICSVDGLELGESKRMVLIYSTEVVNSGMELSDDRVTLLEPGGLPILMRTGKLNLTFRRNRPDRCRLYALALSGERREELPLKIRRHEVEIEIDTARLVRGPTPFFELVAEAE